MRIGYFGDGQWANAALERILATKWMEVAYIVARYPYPDPVMAAWAEKLDIPFFSLPDVNDQQFCDQVRQFTPDINVSMSFDQIIRRRLLDIAPMGFINCHAGALPFYRGRNILNWALINAEQNFGVTVHYVDEGIDTGDIIAQQIVSIEEHDTYASLLEKAVAHCADLLPEVLAKLAAGTAERIPQKTIHPVGTYFGRRQPGDEMIDWSRPSREIHGFVRALVPPGPCARTAWKDTLIGIVATQLIPDAPCYREVPGRVVGRDKSGVVVKTGDSSIRVTGIVRLVKNDLCQQVEIPAFTVGTRFAGGAELRIREIERRISLLEDYILASQNVVNQ